MQVLLSDGTYVMLRPAAEVLHLLPWGHVLSHCLSFPICKRGAEPEALRPAEKSACVCPQKCFGAFLLLSRCLCQRCIWAEGSGGNSWPRLPARAVLAPRVCVLEVGSQPALAQRAPLRDCGERRRRECKPSSPLPLLAAQKTPRGVWAQTPGAASMAWLRACCHRAVPSGTLALAAAHTGRVGASVGTGRATGGGGGSQEEFCSFPAPSMPGQPLGLQDFPVVLPLQSGCRSKFIKKENEDDSVEELQPRWVGLGSIKHVPMSPASQLLRLICPPHLSARLLSPLVPLALQTTPVKLSLVITRRAAKQLTACFTVVPQVHHWELYVSVPQAPPVFPLLQLFRAVGKAVISALMHHHSSSPAVGLYVISLTVPVLHAVLQQTMWPLVGLDAQRRVAAWGAAP